MPRAGAGSTWRVGVLFSSSGVTASVERTQLNATLLAIEAINRDGGVGGKPIEPVAYDPASNPKQFRTLAEKLLRDDGVRLIFGCYMSSTRKAVLPVVETYRGLLFYPTLYEGFEYSPNCIYTGAAPNQNAAQLARFLFEEYGKRFLLVGSNYIYPYESNRIMSDLVRQIRGEVLDEFYVPLDPRPEDFNKALAAIGRTRPDVVFSTVVGRATAMFYEAYHEAGFDAARTPIASLTTSEAEVAEMSEAAAAHHVTAAPFFDSLQTPAAVRFIGEYRRHYGADAPVPATAEAAYFQVHLVADAILRAGSDDPAALIAALREVEFDAPQGRVRVDAENHHTYLWPRIARLDEQGRFEVVRDSAVRVKPDPYRVVLPLESWGSDAVPVRA